MNFHDRILGFKENNGRSVGVVMQNATSLFSRKYSNKSDETLQSKFEGELIPGKIYIFDYHTDAKINKKIKYINYRPIAIYCGRGDKLLNGDRIEFFIDFIAIPHHYRAEILKRISDHNYDAIEHNSNNIKNLQTPIDLRSKTLKSLLINTGYLNAYVGFKQRFIRDIKIVDYSDWEAIPYLNVNSITGKDLSEIYKEYQMKLN